MANCSTGLRSHLGKCFAVAIKLILVDVEQTTTKDVRQYSPDVYLRNVCQMRVKIEYPEKESHVCQENCDWDEE